MSGETNKVKKNNKLLIELLTKQRKDIETDKKLYLQDIQRICKNINSSIFIPDKCCLWNGYITNLNKSDKGTYINFYFRQKKVALHRLLYMNYIEDLKTHDYLKYTCSNKGLCCNIYHLEKFKYNNIVNIEESKDNIKNTKNNIKKKISIINQDCTNDEKKKLFIVFK